VARQLELDGKGGLNATTKNFLAFISPFARDICTLTGEDTCCFLVADATCAYAQPYAASETSAVVGKATWTDLTRGAGAAFLCAAAAVGGGGSVLVASACVMTALLNGGAPGLAADGAERASVLGDGGFGADSAALVVAKFSPPAA
jgi:hypothetical protein